MKILKPVLLFLAVTLMPGCRKNNQTDFRDALIGSYSCYQTYSSFNPQAGHSSSTISDTILVIKSETNPHVIFFNGDTFTLSQNSGSEIDFNGNLANMPGYFCGNTASFFNNGDSIYNVSGCEQVSNGYSTTNQGHKLR